ncbi:MAG: GNAT family N-acetyltransferase [Acidobacteria bacterium]|nr:MAG: GNAT family N-acetyltransferase [Acidobacteriota bacterium]REK08771.1 MAG: GNAT family N-acetyltransferase [Acidobacteriota bacterium]
MPVPPRPGSRPGSAALRRPFRLAEVTAERLDQLAGWWSSADEVLAWGGPEFRWPFDDDSFRDDLRLQANTSRFLVDSRGRTLAFGQSYGRGGRLHLARLAVAPDRRGAGVGGELIRRLIRLGGAGDRSLETSLFVLAENSAAIRCYEREGFRRTSMPAGEGWLDRLGGREVLFMVRPADRAPT